MYGPWYFILGNRQYDSKTLRTPLGCNSSDMLLAVSKQLFGFVTPVKIFVNKILASGKYPTDVLIVDII